MLKSVRAFDSTNPNRIHNITQDNRRECANIQVTLHKGLKCVFWGLKVWLFFHLQMCDEHSPCGEALYRERRGQWGKKSAVSRTGRLHPNKCWGTADSPSQAAAREKDRKERSSKRRKRLIVSKNTYDCLHFPSFTKGHLKVPWPLLCCLINPM